MNLLFSFARSDCCIYYLDLWVVMCWFICIDLKLDLVYNQYGYPSDISRVTICYLIYKIGYVLEIYVLLALDLLWRSLHISIYDLDICYGKKASRLYQQSVIFSFTVYVIENLVGLFDLGFLIKRSLHNYVVLTILVGSKRNHS